MNEEKEPLWFVWEKVSRGGMVSAHQPALYRGEPRTGSGEVQDRSRFIFKHQVLLEEQHWKLNQFIEKYPFPEVQDAEEKTSCNTTKSPDTNATADGLAGKDSPNPD